MQSLFHGLLCEPQVELCLSDPGVNDIYLFLHLCPADLPDSADPRNAETKFHVIARLPKVRHLLQGCQCVLYKCTLGKRHQLLQLSHSDVGDDDDSVMITVTVMKIIMRKRMKITVLIIIFF